MAEELGVDRKMPVLRKDRMSTGVAALDLMLDGGYGNPSTVLLIGPAGSEKQVFSAHFVAAALEAGDSVLYVCTDKSPREVEKDAGARGIRFRGKVNYIDCYSGSVSEKPAGGMEGAKEVSGPSALTELSLAITEEIEKMKGKRVGVVFSSLSTLALYNQQGTLFKFFTSVENRLKNAGATILVLVEEGMHDEKFLMTLKHNIDEEFEVKMGAEGGKVLSSPELPLEVPIKVGSLGVEVE